MPKFEVSGFSVRVSKTYGFFVTITGTCANRDEPIKLKKFFKKDAFAEVLPDLVAGEMNVVIIGRRNQTDFEARNNIQYYDFVLEDMDWTDM
ncbi:Oidioi.mRNA.OKI2018_I69.chr1.g1234.t1.cds [Oikopleura dioica]|uniref:Oidioi.mRNA.OKI2018_I69.chr1.g1234.t1.cds n=1 Tax=Oikopleura dioica TaxID=34765 RepID=A0ABN7SMA4_OIKDI|nr:Oidioi.mRNA.OKI2018_I69.chr1.g1234.t1.cds [Oikopleura dioica]